MASYGDVSLAGMQNQPLWRQLLQRLQQSGVQIDPSQTSGFAPRNIAGTNTPSQHAFGRAMDVNYNANPEGQANQRTPLPYDMYGESARKPTTFIDPDVARDAASRLGFKWGGDFQSRSPDPMHFEGPVGPAMPTPLRAPMGAFGLGGPPAEQPQDFQTMFPGAPQTGETMSAAPAPANDPYPYGKEPDMAPVSTAAAPSPITTGSISPRAVENRGDMSGGMPPAMAGGGGFGGWLQNWAQNPLFLEGFMAATQGTNYRAGAGANIATKSLEQRRQETLFQQQQAEYNKRQQIWDQAFPNGQANPDHPLTKGVPPELAAAVYAAGPEVGIPWLQKFSMDKALPDVKFLPDQFGQPTQPVWVNARNQTITPGKIEGGLPTGASGTPLSSLQGPEFLQELSKQTTPATANIVKAIAEGRQPPLAQGRGNVRNQSIMAWVAQYDPTFDLTEWKKRNETETAYAKGPEGRNITAITTLRKHLMEASEAVDNLHNANAYGGTLLRTITNPIAGAIVPSAESRLKQFNMAKDAVTEELGKVFHGGASVTETENWKKEFNDTASPQALHAAIGKAIKLVEGRAEELTNSYTRALGRAPERPFIEPSTTESFEALKRKGALWDKLGRAPTAKEMQAAGVPANAETPGKPAKTPTQTVTYGNKTYEQIDGKWYPK